VPAAAASLGGADGAVKVAGHDKPTTAPASQQHYWSLADVSSDDDSDGDDEADGLGVSQLAASIRAALLAKQQQTSKGQHGKQQQQQQSQQQPPGQAGTSQEAPGSNAEVDQEIEAARQRWRPAVKPPPAKPSQRAALQLEVKAEKDPGLAKQVSDRRCLAVISNRVSCW
jgi:hypothetical protein